MRGRCTDTVQVFRRNGSRAERISDGTDQGCNGTLAERLSTEIAAGQIDSGTRCYDVDHLRKVRKDNRINVCVMMSLGVGMR